MASIPQDYPAWVKTPEEVQHDLRVDLAHGLSDDEVEIRRAAHGFNELEKEPPTPWWKLLLEQFDDMLVKVCACLVMLHAMHLSRTPCPHGPDLAAVGVGLICACLLRG